MIELYENEEGRKQDIYEAAVSKQTKGEYLDAVKLYEMIPDYKDAVTRSTLCKTLYEKELREKTEYIDAVVDAIRNKGKEKPWSKMERELGECNARIAALQQELKSLLEQKELLEQKIQEVKGQKIVLTYQEAIEAIKDPTLKEIIRKRYSLDELDPALAMMEVGSTVSFGRYRNESIRWKVLDARGDRRLLISEKVLGAMLFNTSLVSWEKKSCVWADSWIRRWLNGTFMENAFSDDERRCIESSNITARYDAEKEGFTTGGTTEDQVFLLSTEEAKNYFASDKQRSCRPTELAKREGVAVLKDDANSEKCWWWLRTPGRNTGAVTAVSFDGSIDEKGYMMTHYEGGVRPAMWVDMSRM